MNLLYKNTNVHFTSIGKGKAVVLIHGFLENSTMWNQISQELSKKYRIICIDLLGHGKTEMDDWDYNLELKENFEFMLKTVKDFDNKRKLKEKK